MFCLFESQNGIRIMFPILYYNFTVGKAVPGSADLVPGVYRYVAASPSKITTVVYDAADVNVWTNFEDYFFPGIRYLPYSPTKIDDPNRLPEDCELYWAAMGFPIWDIQTVGDTPEWAAHWTKHNRVIRKWIQEKINGYHDEIVQDINTVISFKEEVEEDPSFYPGKFPETPNLHMVFYDGRSFYIPNGLTVNTRLTDNFRGTNLLVLTTMLDPSGIFILKKWTVPMKYTAAYGKGSDYDEPDYDLFKRLYDENIWLQTYTFGHLKTPEEIANTAQQTNKFDLTKKLTGGV